MTHGPYEHAPEPNHAYPPTPGAQSPGGFEQGAQWPAPQPVPGSSNWQYGPAPESGYGQQPGGQWMPAPTPGLFPLRPLAFGDALAATFRLFRTSPKTTLGSAVIVMGATTLFASLLPVVVGMLMFTRIPFGGSQEDITPMLVSSITLTSLAAIFGLAIAGVGSALLQGILVRVVARGAIGEKLGFKEAWRAGWRGIWRLIGYALIVGVGSLLLIAVGWLLIPFILFMVLSGSGADEATMAGSIGLGVIFTLLLGGATVVLMVWVGIKIMFAPSAIVLEGLGPIAAIRRSWGLSHGNFWRVLGIVVVIQVILNFATGAVSTVAQLAVSMGQVILTPLGSGQSVEPQAGTIVAFAVILLVTSALQVLLGAIVLVLTSGNATILYFDLRMRKEGLGVTLQRYAEQSAAGAEITDADFDVQREQHLPPMTAPGYAR
ncbi:hypothetical protein [Pseudoclavibacter sp. RFBA6]|uniref:hypothetical protein n=1 Tax=Pseudoclavibacter sp. RFBA6 TaxID=2080573 RepID=UPI000CE8FD3C|nr:hypothetical protein [Pseudoclavibacter sp. RFBA6]